MFKGEVGYGPTPLELAMSCYKLQLAAIFTMRIAALFYRRGQGDRETRGIVSPIQKSGGNAQGFKTRTPLFGGLCFRWGLNPHLISPLVPLSPCLFVSFFN